MSVATRPFNSAILGDAASTVDFITNILQASTEYSIIGKNLDGMILRLGLLRQQDGPDVFSEEDERIAITLSSQLAL